MMTSGESNTTASVTFDLQAGELAYYIQAALEAAQRLGSTAGHVEVLNDSLGHVVERLGILATDVTSIIHTGRTASLREEGVPFRNGDTVVGEQSVVAGDYWLKPENQARLTIQLSELPSPYNEPKGIGKRAVGALSGKGIASLQQVVCIGSESLLLIDKLTPPRLEWLKEAIALHDAELPRIPEVADPALVAQICSSLADVPLICTATILLYDSSVRSRGRPPSSISIAEFLATPPEELLTYEPAGSGVKGARPMQPTDPLYRKDVGRCKSLCREFQSITYCITY